ncbi:MAG: histidine--tRNA ligase [Candidatus Paceibacterota bacterium]
MSNSNNKISTDAYKGVRDFYPEDLRRRRYLEKIMQKTVESFGYEAVDASILEPAALYDAKSGEELAGEQSYRFTDRGDREVMLRPEMTPSIARMVAAQAKTLSFPVRWYAIPNVFRYERPQRGRLREHWQLNVDLFGIEDSIADTEIISVAHELMKNLGAAEDDFVIHISSRSLFSDFCTDVLKIDDDLYADLAGLIDKKTKIDKDSFTGAVHDLLSEDQAEGLFTYLSITDTEQMNETFPMLAKPLNKLDSILESLANRNIGNAVFDPNLIRGIAYYTGVVFEIFDTHPQNNRSLFGGGRYDDLMEVFDVDPVPAVGFGAGDVTLADFMDAHELWPDLASHLDVDICLIDTKKHSGFGYEIAGFLRQVKMNTRVNISGKNIGTQLKNADKDGANYVIVIGDDELESEKVTIKELSSGEEATVKKADIADFFINEEE